MAISLEDKTNKKWLHPTGEPVVKVKKNSVNISINQIASRDYPDLYKDIDIDEDDLGCIMLDLAPMEVMKHVEGMEDDLFENPKFDQGSVPAETTPHVTLLYGLLENGNKWKNKVDLLLKDWKLKSVKIDHVDFFETSDSYAIVAHLEKTPELVDGHERLTLLPHVNTFSEYKPHMTLAYVSLDADPKKWVNKLAKIYNGKTIKAFGINYGDKEDNDNNNNSSEKNRGVIYGGSSPIDWKDKNITLDAPEDSLSSVGQEHNSLSKSGFIVAYNALESDTRDIIKSQENKLRDSVAAIELRMVESSMSQVSKNFLDNRNDVISKSEQDKFEKELAALLIVFYINMFPIFGRQLMAQRSAEYGLVVPYEVTKQAQNYIEEMASKTSQSHIATVTNDILKAAQLAYDKSTIDNLIIKIQSELLAGNESIQQLLPPNPTTTQIRRAAEAGKFDRLSIYKDAQRLAQQGEGRNVIVRGIRNKYQDISKNRATTIARTESARVFNQSQYEADRQFLNNAGLMDRAYKQLRSRTGSPCEYCQMLINMPPIPFEKNFADLGTHLTVTETNDTGGVKVKKLPINWEPVSAGNVHPNCNCEYVLIIKD